MKPRERLETSRLTWVNLLDPGTNTRNPHLRKKIRSHVTKLQHARKLETAPNRPRQEPSVPDYYPQNVISAEYESWQQPGDTETWMYPSIKYQIEDDTTREGYEIVHGSRLAELEPMSSFEVMLAHDFYQGPSPRLFLDPLDDLDHHLRRLGSNVSEAFSYYGYVVDCQGSEFEVTYSLSPGRPKNALIPFLTTDYTLLTAVCLLCITSMNPPAQRSAETAVELLRMRLFAINAIQKAMQEQSDALSDQLIVAVTYFAGYEAIYGSRERYEIHMNGLRKMIQLRGGFATFGLDGLLEALIRYYDANAAGLIGCAPYLNELSSTKPVRNEADKHLFLAGLAGIEHHHNGGIRVAEDIEV